MNTNCEVYQHFKGGLYIKLYEAIHTETNEIMVVYVCAASGEVFVRPKEMFYENVDKSNYSGPRFRKVPYIAAKAERKNLKIL